MSPAKIKLNAVQGGGSVSLEAPTQTTGNADVEFVLPIADGVGSLVSDGSGNLSIGSAGSSQITKDLTLASGASATNAKAVNINQSGQLEQLPTMSSIGTFVADNNYILRPTDVSFTDGYYLSGSSSSFSPAAVQEPYVRFSKALGVAPYRVRVTNSISNNVCTMTIQGQIINVDGTYTNGSTTQTLSADSNNPNSGVQSEVRQWYGNYWIALVWSRRYATNYSSNETKTAIQMFTVDPANGNITMLGSRLTNNWSYNSGHAISAGGAYFASMWNAPTINLKSAFGNGTQTKYYKPTTSGISLIDTFQNQSNTANASTHVGYQDGNATIYAAQTSALITGTKSVAIDGYISYAAQKGKFRVFDFTGTASQVSNIQDQISSTDLNTGSGAYSSEGMNAFINGTHFIHCYRTINNVRRIQTFSYDQSGNFTLIDTLEYETPTISETVGKVVGIAVKSNTEIAIITQNASGVKGVSSIGLDSSYNILGIKDPILLADIHDEIFYHSGNVFIIYKTAADGSYQAAPYTVNGYINSVPFIYGGIAQETTSSGTAKVAMAGIATGFTGLTVGSKYYIDPLLNGNITTDNTSGIVAGVAVSPTELLVGDVR